MVYWNYLNDDLSRAIDDNDIMRINQYIDTGADLNKALHTAARNSNFSLVDYLLFKGANDINAGLSGAWGNSENPSSADMTKHLIEIAQANGMPFSFHYPIYTAVDLQDYDLLDFLIKKGASVDEIASGLIEDNNHDMLDWLFLDYGDRIVNLDKLLEEAIEYGNEYIIELINSYK